MPGRTGRRTLRVGDHSSRIDSAAAPRCRTPGLACGNELLNSLRERLCPVTAGDHPPSSNTYELRLSECTFLSVNVSVTELRAHLSDWLDRARAGGEVIITDRGIPVARLAALDNAGTLERLTADGVIGKATAQRPIAAGRAGPRPRRPVSDQVSDQRR